MRNNIFIFKKINIKLFILYSCIYFSTVFYVIYHPLKFLIVIFPLVFIYCLILKYFLINKKLIYISIFYLFISYGLLSIILFYLVSNIGYGYIPLFGFLNLCLHFILWYFIFNDKLGFEYIFENSIKMFIIFSIVIAIFAIIQYFISPDLFGMISNDIYAQDLSIKPHINKRAISFISSPQSLSLFLSILFIVGYYNIKKSIWKFIFIFLVFFAGILTFSKVFILVLISFIIFNLLLNISIKNFICLCSFIIILLVIFLNFSNSNRTLEIIDIILNIKTHVTFLVWMDYINYDTTFFQFCFGHGLGLVSRASQILFNYHILNGSTESFLLQIYFEIGIVGLIIFLILYITSILNFIHYKKYKQYGILLLSFLPALLGTPSFYGFTNNFILSFFIISGLMIKKGE